MKNSSQLKKIARQKTVEITAKVNNLTTRERAIIALTAVVATIITFLQLLWIDSFDQAEIVSNDLAKLHNEKVILLKTLDILDQKSKVDPDTSLRIQNKQLQEQLDVQEKALVSVLGYLVKPAEIVGLLQQVLRENSELKVVGFESLPVEQVFGPESISEVSTNETGTGHDAGSDSEGIRKSPAAGNDGLYARLYSHRVKIQLEAGFFATLGYLQRLESLETGLLFENLEYKVNEYPNASVTLIVETIGLDEEWLGV